MATTTAASYGVIEPALVYDLEGAARALGQTKRWVQDQIIRSDEVEHRRHGQYVGIPGWKLIQWVEGDLRRHSEWQKDDDAPPADPAPPTPKSGSKR